MRNSKRVTRILANFIIAFVAVAAMFTASTSALADSLTGNISGIVTDASTGAPVANVCVTAYSQPDTAGVSGYTQSDGAYTISGLPAGLYYVVFYPNCTDSTNYPNYTTLSNIVVTSGSTTENVDVKLVEGGVASSPSWLNSTTTGSISVGVTDPSTGQAIEGVCVAEYSASQEATHSGGLSLTTATDGVVQFGNLLPGTYTLYVLPNCNQQTPYVGQTVISVVVTAEITTYLTVNPELGVSVSGVITDVATGKPLSGICVDAGGSSFQVATTGSNGTYTIVGLSPGPYTIEANVSWYWAPGDTCTSKPNYAPMTRIGSGVGISGQNITNLDVGLTSFTGVPNTVTISSGAPTTVSQSFEGAEATALIPAGALPDGTVVSLYPVTDSSPLLAQLPTGASYLTSFVVSWVSPDASSPTALIPLTVTVNDNDIVAGDIAFMPTSEGLVQEATASSNGTLAYSITTDPTLILSNPLIIDASSISNRGILDSKARSVLTTFAKSLNSGAGVELTAYCKGAAGLGKGWAESVENFLEMRKKFSITVKTVSHSKVNYVTVISAT